MNVVKILESRSNTLAKKTTNITINILTFLIKINETEKTDSAAHSENNVLAQDLNIR